MQYFTKRRFRGFNAALRRLNLPNLRRSNAYEASTYCRAHKRDYVQLGSLEPNGDQWEPDLVELHEPPWTVLPKHFIFLASGFDLQFFTLNVPLLLELWGSSYDGICVGEMTTGGSVSNVGKAVTANPTVCDIQDPGVVYFNNGVTSYYYLYADGITKETGYACGAGPYGGHAAIYGWYSSNGLSFTALNSGNPVIQFPDDADGCWSCYTGPGINGPSPVVMAECSCIRMYYWYGAPREGLISGGSGVESQDSTNGTNFSNERVIWAYGYWPQVKKTGLYGDYPLVMTIQDGATSDEFVSAISGFNDQTWACEYSCAEFAATSINNYPAHLESDPTGLLLDTTQSPISISSLINSGEQLDLDWDNSTNLYRGPTTGLNLFPDLADVPTINEFVPSSYPNNTGVTQTFYIIGQDEFNGSAITYLQPFLSNYSGMSNLTNSCHLLYDSSNNTLYLDNSAGDFSWVGSQPYGGSWSGSNSNSVCQVNSWSTSTSTYYLTLTVNLTFLENSTWYEFASATNAAGSSAWVTNGLTWVY